MLEHGLRFILQSPSHETITKVVNPATRSHTLGRPSKKSASSPTGMQRNGQDEESQLFPFSYWVVGRLLEPRQQNNTVGSSSSYRELYVCFRDGSAQNMAEMAFKLFSCIWKTSVNFQRTTAHWYIILIGHLIAFNYVLTIKKMIPMNLHYKLFYHRRGRDKCLRKIWFKMKQHRKLSSRLRFQWWHRWAIFFVGIIGKCNQVVHNGGFLQISWQRLTQQLQTLVM